ncbi:alcohol dehydrogenase [Nemania diffusa]|nr:alcohol dehydrogenase [Nemania diffusa]
MMASQQRLQRAALLIRENGGYRFDVQQTPIPEIQPWEILVSISVSGVCGTDASLAAGHLGPSCDILGHEGVGRIEKVGSGVDPSIAKIGDRVGVGWVQDVCGQCLCCRVPGGETRCVEEIFSGRKRNGTFAEYCSVSARYLMVIPEDVKIADELVAPILCGGVTAYKALKVCEASPGEWVAILGAGGGVGALGIQYARAMGYRVLAIDVSPDMREQCLAFGAELFLDARDDLSSAVQKATEGLGAKAVIVTAGAKAAYQDAFKIVASFGIIVCVGIPPLHESISFHPLKFIDSGVKLVGSLTGTRADTIEALRFVQRGAVTPKIQTISLEGLSDAIKSVGKPGVKYVVRL